MHWFLDPIQKHYADFDGRVGRQEFWMFILFSVGIQIFFDVIGIEILAMIASLALIVPSFALGARRLHDTGRSGWWQLLWLIPVIGWIIIIIFCAQETTATDNQFGVPAQPKMPGGSTPGAAVVTPAVAAPVVTDETVVRDAEEVTDTDPK